MQWKSVLLILGVGALCFVAIPIRIDKSDTTHEKLFLSYIKKFNKTYETNETEYQTRLAQFQESLKQIETLNAERPSESSAKYGITKFSDLSTQEFLYNHLQPKLHERLKHQHKHRNKNVKRAVIDTLPMHIDWRERNVVTAIRDQKTCGACWAFSTVETVESMYALKYGLLQSLSVQEIIDCAGNGNLGCSGGDTCSLLEWLAANNIKIEKEKDYPLMWKNQACKLKGSDLGVQIAPNFTCQYLVGNEDALLQTLAVHGPVIAAINALSWQNYLGGVIQFHCDGGPEHLNHAVQIVGYDRTAEIPHYIVRNSWGAEFGDKGYIYIAIGSNICGLATEVSSVDVL